MSIIRWDLRPPEALRATNITASQLGRHDLENVSVYSRALGIETNKVPLRQYQLIFKNIEYVIQFYQARPQNQITEGAT